MSHSVCFSCSWSRCWQPKMMNIHSLPACFGLFLHGPTFNRRDSGPVAADSPSLPLTRIKTRGDTSALEFKCKQTKLTNIKNYLSYLLSSISILPGFQSCFCCHGCEPQGRAIERLSFQLFLSSPCPKLTLMKDKPKQEKIMHAAPFTVSLQSLVSSRSRSQLLTSTPVLIFETLIWDRL